MEIQISQMQERRWQTGRGRSTQRNGFPCRRRRRRRRREEELVERERERSLGDELEPWRNGKRGKERKEAEGGSVKARCDLVL